MVGISGGAHTKASINSEPINLSYFWVDAFHALQSGLEIVYGFTHLLQIHAFHIPELFLEGEAWAGWKFSIAQSLDFSFSFADVVHLDLQGLQQLLKVSLGIK